MGRFRHDSIYWRYTHADGMIPPFTDAVRLLMLGQSTPHYRVYGAFRRAEMHAPWQRSALMMLILPLYIIKLRRLYRSSRAAVRAILRWMIVQQSHMLAAAFSHFIAAA